MSDKPVKEMQATLFLNRQVIGLKPKRAERFWWMARVVDGTGRIEVEMHQLSRSASREDCEARGRAFLSGIGIGLRGVMERIWTSAECDYAEEVEAEMLCKSCRT